MVAYGEGRGGAEVARPIAQQNIQVIIRLAGGDEVGLAVVVEVRGCHGNRAVSSAETRSQAKAEQCAAFQDFRERSCPWIAQFCHDGRDGPIALGAGTLIQIQRHFLSLTLLMRRGWERNDLFWRGQAKI